MGNGRVGEHALEAPLAERGDVAHGHGEHRQYGQHRAPVVVELGQRLQEYPAEHGKAGGLGSHGHERGDDGGRALVHVRGPQVEGGGRHLEAEAGNEQGQGGEQGRVGGQVQGVDQFADANEVRGTGQAVNERHAEQQQGRGKAAEQEVLGRGLAGTAVGLVQADHGVDGQGHEFQAQVQGDQVAGRGHDQHAHQGKEHQAVVLALAHARHGPIGLAHQGGEDRPAQADGLEHGGIAVGDEHAAKGAHRP